MVVYCLASRPTGAFGTGVQRDTEGGRLVPSDKDEEIYYQVNFLNGLYLLNMSFLRLKVSSILTTSSLF